MTYLDQFLAAHKTDMLRALKGIVRDCQAQIRRDPSLYKETDESEPSIDVRLCVNAGWEPGDDGIPRFNWTFRTGCVDYDTYHSTHCAAWEITGACTASEVLDNLIEQLEDHDDTLRRQPVNSFHTMEIGR